MILFRFIFSLLIGCFLSFTAFSQDIHPKIRVQIDSMQQWMQHEIQTKGEIDQEKMKAWNEKINALKEEVKAEEEKRMNDPEVLAKGERMVKSGMSGSAWTVPKGEEWEVTNVSVSESIGGYSVVVSSFKTPLILQAGEKLSTPSYSPEASLLSTDQSAMTYKFVVLRRSAP